MYHDCNVQALVWYLMKGREGGKFVCCIDEEADRESSGVKGKSTRNYIRIESSFDKSFWNLFYMEIFRDI